MSERRRRRRRIRRIKRRRRGRSIRSRRRRVRGSQASDSDYIRQPQKTWRYSRAHSLVSFFIHRHLEAHQSNKKYSKPSLAPPSLGVSLSFLHFSLIIRALIFSATRYPLCGRFPSAESFQSTDTPSTFSHGAALQ
jgi:hypothetical protein